MRRRIQVALLGLALALAGALAPAARAATSEAVAEQLMRKSGLWAQLAEVAPQVRATVVNGMDQAPQRPSDADKRALLKAFDDAYTVQRLRGAGLATIVRHTDDRHVPVLIQWFDSALGKTVAQLEAKALADPQDPQVQAQEGVALFRQQTAERQRMLQELVKVTRGGELLANIGINTAMAVFQGAAAAAASSANPPASPEAQAEQAQAVRRTLEAQRPRMVELYNGLTLAGYARMYDPLPTVDLQAYLAFLQTEAGQHLNEVIMQAFDAAMVAASTELGRILAVQRGLGSGT